MRYTVLLFAFAWSGCGLLLDPDVTDPNAADAAAFDASDAGDAARRDASRDGSERDGGGENRRDGGASDAIVTSDATWRDGMPSDATVLPDAVSGPLPVVIEGGFGIGSESVQMLPGPGYAAPVPAQPDKVYVQTSEGLEPTMVEGQITKAGGVVDMSPSIAPGYPDYVVFHPSSLEDGWYCLEVFSTPSLAGVRLDGEYYGVFPSGDGYAGGSFIYVFGVLRGDVDRNGIVDTADLVAFDGGYAAILDVNADGIVDAADRSFIEDRRGETLPALTSSPTGTSCPPLPGGG